MSTKRPATTLGDLPLELVDQIISYLDTTPPSFEKIVLEPSLDLTVSKDKPLKNLARTSQGLRRIVLPYLFRYTRLHLGLEGSTVSVRDAGLHGPTHSDNETHIKSETTRPLQIPCPCRQATTTYNEVARPPQPDHRPYLEFVTSQNLQKHVTSLVISTAVDAYLEDPSSRYPCCDTNLAGIPGLRTVTFWKDIFSVLNPSRLVLLAPPPSLAYFLDMPISMKDAWAFEIPYQLLELRQHDNLCAGLRAVPIETSRDHEKGGICSLREGRWEHLLLNEGSHLKAYSTYEYFFQDAPSISNELLTMVGCYRGKERRLTSFTYISIFPSYNHMEKIYGNLGVVSPELALIRPASIHLKLAPDPLENLLGNPKRQGRADLNDCWSEFESSYQILAYTAKQLGRAGHLKSVSSGDYHAEAIKAIVNRYMGTELHGWTRSGLGAWTRDEHDTSPSKV